MNPPDPTAPTPDEPFTDFGAARVPEPSPDPPEPGSAAPCPSAVAPLSESEAEPGDTDNDEPEDEADELDFEEPAEEDASALLADWKSRLRYEFERWLSTVDEIPWVREAQPEPHEPPDLYTFFEQLAVLNTESRRANRRTAETLSQWGEALRSVQGDLERVRELATQSLSARGPAERLSRTHCLALVEVLDRLQRLAAAFARAPSRSWLGGDAAWRRAWENQRQAFLIVTDHLEALLRKDGVTPIETPGKPFDPHLMTAVAVEATRQQPPQTVLEETARGYLWNGELLRVAQVKIAVPPTSP